MNRGFLMCATLSARVPVEHLHSIDLFVEATEQLAQDYIRQGESAVLAHHRALKFAHFACRKPASRD